MPKCPDCGGDKLLGPDHEGFLDCMTCGAAWLPSSDEEG